MTFNIWIFLHQTSPPLVCPLANLLSIKTKADLVKGFRAEGVLTKYNKVMVLTDEELGASLENKMSSSPTPRKLWIKLEWWMIVYCSASLACMKVKMCVLWETLKLVLKELIPMHLLSISSALSPCLSASTFTTMYFPTEGQRLCAGVLYS